MQIAMKYLKETKIAALLTLIVILGGCDDKFDETNENPNNPEEVTPDLLLTTIVRKTATYYFNENWDMGNVVSDQVANQFESAFNWSADQSSLWSDYYSQLRNVDEMIDIAEDAGENNYKGIALVLKSWMFQVLTDVYGDLPYSEALSGDDDGNFSPAYDEQEDIYAGLLADLEEANEILDTSDESVTGDILYDGDLIKWKKFANSLRVRILMRMSDRADPSAALQKILDDPTTYPLFSENDDQAALQYLDEYPNEFPLYYTLSGTFAEFHISETLQTQLDAMADTRLTVYAQPTAATAGTASPVYAGVPNGVGSTVESSYNGGADYQSLLGLLWAGEESNDLASPTAAQSILMSYAELLFTLAEAAQKGYISGDAQTYYLAGINANFAYWQSRIPDDYTLPAADEIEASATYLAQDDVAYTGTDDEKLNKIGVQKWIANFFNGMEAWADWRRTGIPALEAGPAASNDGEIPLRYLYPYDEQALNEENYDKAVARQPDELSTHLWWDVD